MKCVPYIGPVIQGVGLAMDAKEIVKNSTPLGTTKIMVGRFIKECTPPEIFFAWKCVMFFEGLIISVSTGGNFLVVSGTMLAARPIIKDL